MSARVPASERTSQRLRELLNGLGDDEVGSQVIRLGIRKIVEEALEAELRDVVGRGYYEHGAEPGRGYRNGKPGQSLVGGISCALDLTLDGFAIFMNARVKGDKATLKGTLLTLRDEDNDSAICKISLKRINTTDPAIVCQS